MSYKVPQIVEESYNARAEMYYRQSRNLICWQIDRGFALLLPLQWLVVIVFTYYVLPANWSAVYKNNETRIWFDFLIGLIVVLPPVILALKFPGEKATRYTIAVCQMMMSGLFVYLIGSQTEANFHIFVSLAALSFYRDWRVFIPAVVSIGINHLIRGWFFAFTIDGNITIEEWRWIGYTAFMIFEIAFLIVLCRRNSDEMRQTAIHTAALEASEEIYRAVVEQTEEGIALLDTTTLKVIECNESFSRLLGCESVDEAKTLTAYDYNTDATWEISCNSAERRNRKATFSGEKHYRRRDKSLVPVQVNVSIITYAGRQVFCVNVKDITERKYTEAEMLRLALVVQKTQNAVIISDSDGCIQWVNEGFTRLTGYKPEDVIGELAYFLQGENTNPETVENIRQSMLRREPCTCEIYNYSKDNRGFWLSISITPIRNDKGEVQGFIAVIMEITERKAMEDSLRVAHDNLEQRVSQRTLELTCANVSLHKEVNERRKAEEELRKTQHFLRKIIDNDPNLIFVKDSQSRFLMVNQAVADMYGTTIENLIGKSDADFVSDSSEVKKICEDDQLVLKNLQEKFIYEEKITDCHGVERWLQTVKRPLPLGADGELCVLGIATDLTERKVLEGQLHHSQKMESVGQLAAGIAHEINTPTQYVSDNTRFAYDSLDDINVVLKKYKKLLKAAKKGAINAELLREIEEEIDSKDIEYLMEEVPDALKQAIEGINRIGKIVQSMRTFTHPGVARKMSADLNKAIESTLAVAQNEWRYVADLETDFDENLPPVPCLLDEFNQVILNILLNATHAISEVVGDGNHGKGKIRVSTARIGDSCVEVRISDTGGGIAKDAQSRIFDPFFTTKEFGKGTGQGLAISHNIIVKKHNGQLDFETKPGIGTTFIIRLPLTMEEAKMQEMSLQT